MNPSLPNDYIISHIKRETKESILCNAVNKVAVIGDTGVGKTSFIQSYVNGFPLMAIGTTLGVNFHSMFLDIKREENKTQYLGYCRTGSFSFYYQIILEKYTWNYSNV